MNVPSARFHFRKNIVKLTDTPQPVKSALEKDTEFPFAVSVGEVYDGPLDLLLDLIRKQDVDIYDIPIAQITAQYLAYVERMKQYDVNVAAEFIYMASVLIQIKSRMLLPRDPTLQQDEQEDPRAELVNRLLEHERFKTAAQMLLQKSQIEEAVWTNPAIKEFKNDAGAEPELAADTVDLVRVFQQIIERAKSRPIIEVNEERVTVAQMMDFFRKRLTIESRPMRLKQVLGSLKSRPALICAFLALLEMVRLQAILLRQDRVFSDIIVKKNERFDEVFAEGGVTAMRDDWK